MTCEDLPDPSNGRVELSGNTPDSTATYSCNTGYRLVGAETRICQSDGFWSLEEPICECKFFVSLKVLMPLKSQPGSRPVHALFLSLIFFL